MERCRQRHLFQTKGQTYAEDQNCFGKEWEFLYGLGAVVVSMKPSHRLTIWIFGPQLTALLRSLGHLQKTALCWREGGREGGQHFAGGGRCWREVAGERGRSEGLQLPFTSRSLCLLRADKMWPTRSLLLLTWHDMLSPPGQTLFPWKNKPKETLSSLSGWAKVSVLSWQQKRN